MRLINNTYYYFQAKLLVQADATNRNMINWVLTILAVLVCVIETYASDITTYQKNNFGGFTVKDATGNHTSTVSDDVRCTTIDDVVAARRSLCPARCRCSPLDGQEVLTKLIVDCSGAQFNQSTSSRLVHDLTQLLSRCGSELVDLTVANTPITTVPEVVCKLSRIRALNFSYNRLGSLPSNCFTRMLDLTSFLAYGNRLTLLQVRCDVTVKVTL